VRGSVGRNKGGKEGDVGTIRQGGMVAENCFCYLQRAESFTVT
jgi:hypothetical protein